MVNRYSFTLLGNLSSEEVPRSLRSPTAATNCISVILIEEFIPMLLHKSFKIYFAFEEYKAQYNYVPHFSASWDTVTLSVGSFFAICICLTRFVKLLKSIRPSELSSKNLWILGFFFKFSIREGNRYLKMYLLLISAGIPVCPVVRQHAAKISKKSWYDRAPRPCKSADL